VGAYADFDHREAVAAFDGDFVRPESRLSEKRGRKKRMRHRKEAHTEDSSMHFMSVSSFVLKQTYDILFRVPTTFVPEHYRFVRTLFRSCRCQRALAKAALQLFSERGFDATASVIWPMQLL